MSLNYQILTLNPKNVVTWMWTCVDRLTVCTGETDWKVMC